MYFQKSVNWTEFAMYEFENNGRNAKALWAILNQKGTKYAGNFRLSKCGKFGLTPPPGARNSHNNAQYLFCTFLLQNGPLCKVHEYSGPFGKNSESKRRY